MFKRRFKGRLKNPRLAFYCAVRFVRRNTSRSKKRISLRCFCVLAMRNASHLGVVLMVFIINPFLLTDCLSVHKRLVFRAVRITPHPNRRPFGQAV